MDELKVQGQSPIALSVVQNKLFCEIKPRPMKLSKSKPDDDKDEEISFECNTEGCSVDDLQDHVSFGLHDVKAVEIKESLYDQFRREWAFKFSTLSEEPEKKRKPKQHKLQAICQQWQLDGRCKSLEVTRRGFQKMSDLISQLGLTLALQEEKRIQDKYLMT